MLEGLRSDHGRGVLGGDSEEVGHRIVGAETIGFHDHDVVGGVEADGRRAGKCQSEHAQHGRELSLRALHARKSRRVTTGKGINDLDPVRGRRRAFDLGFLFRLVEVGERIAMPAQERQGESTVPETPRADRGCVRSFAVHRAATGL